MADLSGKVAVVTGAGSVAVVTGAGSVGPGWGNGEATAVLLAREGTSVFLLDIVAEAVRETATLVRDARPSARPQSSTDQRQNRRRSESPC